MTSPDTTRLELAITEMGGRMDAALARIEGRLDLLVQRAEHSDERAADLARQIQRVGDEVDRVDDKVGKVKASAVTRAELEEKSKRTLQVVAIIVAVLGTASSVGVSMLLALIVNGG